MLKETLFGSIFHPEFDSGSTLKQFWFSWSSKLLSNSSSNFKSGLSDQVSCLVYDLVDNYNFHSLIFWILLLEEISPTAF